MKRQQAEAELTRVEAMQIESEARADQMVDENARLMAELEKLRAERGL